MEISGSNLATDLATLCVEAICDLSSHYYLCSVGVLDISSPDHGDLNSVAFKVRSVRQLRVDSVEKLSG